jgi:3-oxoacyl-[acyl-carrier-protein] synthase-1
MKPLRLTGLTATSALGRGLEAHWQALQQGRSGLQQKTFDRCELPCWIGEVDGLVQPLQGDWAPSPPRWRAMVPIGLPCSSAPAPPAP